MPSLPAAHSLFDRPRPVLRPFATAHCGGGFSFHGDSLSRSRGLKHCSLLRRQRATQRPLHHHRGKSFRGHPMDAEQPCAGRGGAFLRPTGQPQASVPFSGSSSAVHFQCCDGWLSESARRPGRAGPGSGPAPAGGRAGLLPIRGRVVARAGPGRARALLALGGAGRVGPRPGLLALGGAGRAGPRPGPARPRGFRRQAGTVAGPPDYGTPGFAHTALTLWVATPSFLSVLACTLFRRRCAALWEPCCAGPSALLFTPSSGAGQDRVQAVGFDAGRSCRV